MFLSDQLTLYYPDLHDPDFESALALVHQRLSTNTFPTWSLAHPYRMIAHNGEINTLRGNNNWMAARQSTARSHHFGDDIRKLWPISYEGQSDTACFDNALEFLVQGGYSLAHAYAHGMSQSELNKAIERRRWSRSRRIREGERQSAAAAPGRACIRNCPSTCATGSAACSTALKRPCSWLPGLESFIDRHRQALEMFLKHYDNSTEPGADDELRTTWKARCNAL